MTTAANRYVSRVCWNPGSWVRPMGAAAAAENNTYVTRMGYGHEEWLFNYEWLIDGWKYAFLQPVGKSLAKMAGRVLDIRLYTISPEANWFYVGQLTQCQVLSGPEARHARSVFKKEGWLSEMRRHVKQVDGDLRGLEYENAAAIFNIRFRTKDAVIYDPKVPVEERDGIRRLRRYALVALDGRRRSIETQWKTRVAATELRPTGKVARAATAARDVDLVHNQLQNDLCEALRKKYGKKAVDMESDFVDVKLTRASKSVLIEVKSDPRPRFAIREALGQLLEYAYTLGRSGAKVSTLVVAAPGELGPVDAAYLEHLRNVRKLPIKYVCFRRGAAEVDL